MKSNEHWPEAFGFKIAGKSPVVIVSVQENSVAQQAELQPGDQILELNGENVQGLTKEQITLLAKRSTRIPPAIAVISRIRTFDLRRRRGRFGFTLRGNGPVYVYDVEDRGPAYNMGMRPGDLVLKVNGINVRHANADQVQQIVEACGPTAAVVMIAGAQSIGDNDKTSSSTSSRYRRARDFYLQMNYFLPRDNVKKSQLIKALNRYAKDRSIEQLAKTLLDVLQTPVERKLLKQIRYLIPNKHKPEYDILVGIAADRRPPQRPQSALLPDSLSRSSTVDDMDLMRTWSSPNMHLIGQHSNRQAHPPRTVRVKRGPRSGFGFTLSGDTPVFVKSVDKGGPAEVAKIKPGDHILEINGLNVRGKRHGNVVELLKGSGTYPSLLVQWRPLSALKHQSSTSTLGSKSGLSVKFNNEDSIRRSASVASRSSTRTEQLLMSRFPGSDPQSVRALAREFKLQMNRLFTNGEQSYIKQCLAEYKQDRNITKLLESIEPVLDDPDKLCILHYMSELLPSAEQAEFDKGAAKIFAKQSQDGVAPSFNSNENDVMDILYRVQGMRLSDTPRERSVIGGSGLSSDKPNHWPGPGAATQWNASTRHDLDMVPVRDTNNGDTINEEEDDDDELNLGLEELADALLEEDRKKAASHLSTKADIHSQASVGSPITATTQSTTEHHPVANGGEDLEGPSRNEMMQDLQSKTQQLEHAQKVISEQQQLIVDAKNTTEVKDSGSEPSKTSFTNDLASAVQARNKEQEEQESVSTSSSAPAPPPPPTGAPPPPPPPPPPGPPPPPPPAIGGVTSIDGSKMTLKRVNWEKLSDVGLENTVWAQLGRNERLDSVIELMELEQNFSTIQKTQEKEKKKDEKPSVLNPKKVYNISILLAHLKMTTSEIKSAVLSMDENKLSEAHIRQLLLYAPDSTELQKYKYLAEDVNKMDKADQFSYEMSKIPYYTQRLKAMLFRLQFDDKVDEIKPDLEAVIDASQELRNCSKFQKLLELVLLTGNYMNKGNVRIAGAQGFKISYLTKLNSTKTTDNKATLLNFLVQKIESKCPEVLTMKEDLKTVPVAAKVSGQMVATEIHDLSRRMKTIQDDLISFQATNIQNEDDRFTDVVIDIIEETEGKLEELLDLQKKMNTGFKQTVLFFGETPSKTTTEDFFAVFAAFLTHFETAIAQNVNKKKLKDEQVKREERAKLFKELKQRSQSITDDEDSAKDELMKSLDERKARVSLSEGPDVEQLIKPQTNTQELKTSPRGNHVFMSEKPVSPPNPVSPSKLVSPPKPVTPPKPFSPKPAVQSKPAVSPKRVKPVIPVKPLSKKTPPPPPKPKPNSDANNNSFNGRYSQTPESVIQDDSLSLDHIEVTCKEQLTKEVPQGFKNIVSAFESSSKDEKPLPLYAVPDKTKKSPKPLEPENHSVKVPEVPPKRFSTPPSRGPQIEDKPISPYEDPGPPNFKPPPPPVGQLQIESLQPEKKTTKDEQITPPLEFKSRFSKILVRDKNIVDNEDVIESTAATPPPVIDRSYTSVDVVTTLPAKPQKLIVADYEEVVPRQRAAPPKPAPYKSSKQEDIKPPREFSASLPSLAADRIENMVVSSHPPKPAPYKSSKEEVVQAPAELSSSIPSPLPDTTETMAVPRRTPPKPVPYKSSKEEEFQPLAEFSPSSLPSPTPDFIVGSPRYPGVGSPRLSSAQLVSNALSENPNRRFNYIPPTPPMRTSSNSTPTSSPSPRRTTKPPPPLRTTSIQNDADSEIDEIIARALSPDMKPGYELDEIPVRDTGPSAPGISPKPELAIAPPPLFGQEDTSVVPMTTWQEKPEIPPLDLSLLGAPPPPPSQPPPSLPIDTHELPSPTGEHAAQERMNGYEGAWDEEDDLVLSPPLPPSSKYGLASGDGTIKPLVPPLRKQRSQSRPQSLRSLVSTEERKALAATDFSP